MFARIRKRKFDFKALCKEAGMGARKYLLLTHRGFGKRGKIAENSLEAFGAATKLGFVGHELDVRLSRDKTVMIFHGPDLSTTTDGHGLIEDTDFSDIRALNCGNYLSKEEPAKSQRGKKPKTCAIPTLEEYLAKFGKTCFTNIEIKREWFNIKDGLEDKAIGLVRQFQCEKKVVFSSFNLLSVYRLRTRQPNILVGQLIDRQRIAWLWIPLCIRFLKPDSIHLHSDMATEKWVRYIKNHDCGVAVWGVNDKTKLENLVNLGVEFLITDNMELANLEKPRKPGKPEKLGKKEAKKPTRKPTPKATPKPVKKTPKK